MRFISLKYKYYLNYCVFGLMYKIVNYLQKITLFICIFFFIIQIPMLLSIQTLIVLYIHDE